jgi:hypothetical protein
MMGALPIIGLAAGLFKKKPSVAAQPAPLLQSQPGSKSAISDALAARRGALANQRTGATGAESSASAKKTLMGQ